MTDAEAIKRLRLQGDVDAGEHAISAIETLAKVRALLRASPNTYAEDLVRNIRAMVKP